MNREKLINIVNEFIWDEFVKINPKYRKHNFKKWR